VVGNPAREIEKKLWMLNFSCGIVNNSTSNIQN
jgi:hypothetical protein